MGLQSWRERRRMIESNNARSDRHALHCAMARVWAMRLQANREESERIRSEVYSRPVQEFQASAELPNWQAHNRQIEESDSAKLETHKAAHLERIQFAQLRAQAAQILRKDKARIPAYCGKVQGGNRTEGPPLTTMPLVALELLATIASREIRLDVAAELWLLLQDEETAFRPIEKLFRRARKATRMAHIGKFTRRKQVETCSETVSADALASTAEWIERQRDDISDIAHAAIRDELPAIYCELLGQGLSQSAIAAELGIDPRRVSERISLARQSAQDTIRRQQREENRRFWQRMQLRRTTDGKSSIGWTPRTASEHVSAITK